MPRTEAAITPGRLVVGMLLLLVVAFGAYMALGMPGMDHSGDGSGEEMEDMEHPRQAGTKRP